jgi:putative nucleotidyltransferase with HDIG domain
MRNWADILKSSNAGIIAWAAGEPWSEPMRRCLQDAQWHAEGDVWTHTLMVCAEVEKLDIYGDLPRLDQLKLLFTALLHDAGKPATTKIDPGTGRTRSLNHSLVGARMTREILRDLHCDLETREQIVRLVRYHGRPPYLLEKAEPEHEVIQLSCLLSNQLLYNFALADTRGRDTNDGSARPEENLHLWRDLAKEHRCYTEAYSFINDHARFLFFRKELSDLHYTPHEGYSCTVTLISGVPGSGKDTWLRKHLPSQPTVSLDAVRTDLDIDATGNQGQVIQAARELCREHLRIGRDFAFNATNTTASIRKRWIDLFHDYKARIQIIYLEPPLNVILKQNNERNDAVPESVIYRLIENMEVPTSGEAHEVILIGH